MALTCITGGKECDGCGNCKQEDIFNCPVCGKELTDWDELYTNIHSDVVGCEYCVEKIQGCEYHEAINRK